MRRLAVVALVALAALAGCADEQRVRDEMSGPLTVFAAASLTDVFGRLGDQFESAHPDVDVRLNFAGSSALATQIIQGAPADVFASANDEQMSVVTDAAEAATAPRPFAVNALTIAVPAGNPAGVAGLADFANSDLTVAICAPEVPCGAAAAQVFAAAGVTPSVDTLEEDVRASLTKVELGEVDAALVYTTDARGAGDAVDAIAISEDATAVNVYPIVALEASAKPAAARAFIDLVLSDAGQEVLQQAGFRPPDGS